MWCHGISITAFHKKQRILKTTGKNINSAKSKKLGTTFFLINYTIPVLYIYTIFYTKQRLLCPPYSSIWLGLTQLEWIYRMSSDYQLYDY